MFEYQISLVTMQDINDFVGIATEYGKTLKLTDKENYTVNAASILGVRYSLEWNSLYLLSEEDVYSLFSRFIIHTRFKTTN